MLEADEDALVCDLAETYGIYNYESLPVQTVATLSVGLRGDSRIKMKMADADLSQSDLIRTIIADYLALLVWFKTKDGQSGRNRPTPLRDLISGAKKQKDIVGFSTPEEFEEARRKILTEVGHG
jgi:hypothetical protein